MSEEKKIDDGGNAYPTPSVYSDSRGDYVEIGAPGMTMLDHFAGQALANPYLMKIYMEGNCNPSNADYMASNAAYIYADAMIAARNKRMK